ncbi:aldehyde dehydrogenase (NADP(+)) [Pedobacter xixiisoli]|uniref:NADP-dependent aldehyde dehydrogenase n=1 Tax=Pedobacter xixiisoli TaxID=1476464 RepID=A0A285ZRC0_9SPHI|nr:aldehyde dehydrogenase (NADP(+)) [Pedobacter xixiisoli]SOD12194.1 NADP-dependent aldehyde dehydrogenase [Pedobacter xixiisoli]
MYQDHTTTEIDNFLTKSQVAFYQYKNSSLKERANFMRTIALEIEALGEELIETAAAETHLSEKRLYAERKRTIFQLNSYANAAERGDWLEVRIDIGSASATPPKPDLRKMLVPLGPVVVFGASNFPFAYSTAGGDTACAFAAGCPVIVKAHPAHVKTSTLVAKAILSAVEKCKMPEGIFAHVYGADFKIGTYLVKHEAVKAVGFTGSYGGGRALFDLANQRKTPIPVFAEMGSINPVFLLPNKLENDHQWIAEQMSRSITQDMGQFCTNPGLIIAVKSDALGLYIKQLVQNIEEVQPARMLHKGIAKSFTENRNKAITQDDVEVIYENEIQTDDEKGIVTIATVSGKSFLNNHQLHEEVFGPFSLLVICEDEKELLTVAESLEGQLTTTLMATKSDITHHSQLLNILKEKCGRLVLNGVPTGVEVALAMHHGGPFPSSTDSRFTAVGADGIKRFARPVSFQNWNDEFLPDELKNENPLNIWRTVNNELTKNVILEI